MTDAKDEDIERKLRELVEQFTERMGGNRAFLSEFAHAVVALAQQAPAASGVEHPERLTLEQEQAAKEWAADDRLWTTQETVEFNLKVFARTIRSKDRLAASGVPDLSLLTNAVLDRAWHAMVETREGNNYVAVRRVLSEALNAAASGVPTGAALPQDGPEPLCIGCSYGWFAFQFKNSGTGRIWHDDGQGRRYLCSERAAHETAIAAEIDELRTLVARKTGLLADLTTACGVHRAANVRWREIVKEKERLIDKWHHRFDALSDSLDELEIANDVIDGTAGTDAYQTGLLSLALATRDFLRRRTALPAAPAGEKP